MILFPEQSADRLQRNIQLECTLESSFDALDSLRGAWDEAVARLGGSIYMTFDWARLWWQFYGHSQPLRLFIFRAGDEIVGILPVYIDRVRLGPFQLSVAKLVGSNIPPKVFSPPISENWAHEIFDRVIAQLFGVDRCDLLSFGPVSELHPAKAKLAGACALRKDLIAQSEIFADGVHSVFQLPSTFEEYFASLSRNERKKRKLELRLLHKEHSAKVEVVRESPALEEEFSRFVTQHTTQWNAQGKPGHFGAWPRGAEFNLALVKAHAALGRVRFVRIIANGQVVTSDYVFAFGPSWFAELPARAMGAEWEGLSLGLVGLVTTVESAIREGATTLHGGIGHYEYKLRLGAREHGLVRLRAVANRTSSRLRVALFKAVRLCVLFGYHKIWYRRLQPRFPLVFNRPQWRLWLRLDF